MANSDYILKAAIKKVSEKLNDMLVEKFEEATNIAQDVPDIIRKEFDNLKESIIEEATRMEYEMDSKQNVQESKTHQNSKINQALDDIKDINKRIERLDKKINNLI